MDVRSWSAEQIIRTIRVVELNGQPWFAAIDVCKDLGRGNPSMAVKLLADSERTLISNEGQGGVGLNAISESGLYKLIMRSKKPVAKPFQDCVTQVVLPAILRKDGGYVSGEEKAVTSTDTHIPDMGQFAGALSIISETGL